MLRQFRDSITQSQDLSIDDMLNDFERQEIAIPETQERFTEMFAELRRQAASRLAP
jgi:hypothetical protein